MPYPNCFYLDESTTSSKKDEYGYSPPGVMQVNLLAQGKPSFRQTFQKKSEDPNQEKPKKHLVLMDHHATQWSEAERAAIKKLRSDGFSISLWQDGYFIKFEHDSQIDDPEVLKKLANIEDYEKVMRTFCSSLLLAEHECVIVDDYWLAVAMNDGKMPVHRVVSLIAEERNIIPYFQNATPPVSAFEIKEIDIRRFVDEYTYADLHFNSKYLVAFRMYRASCKVAKGECALIVSDKEFIEILKGVDIQNRYIKNVNDINAIKKITIDLEGVDDNVLAKNPDEFRSMVMQNGNFLQLSDFDFKLIKKMVLQRNEKNSQYEIESIEYEVSNQSEPILLSTAQTIKDLTVHYRECAPAAIIPPSNTTHLTFEKCNLTLQELEAIIEKTPNLESLSLDGCTIKSNEKLNKRELFPFIKETTSQSEVGEESLESIPYIKKMSLPDDPPKILEESINEKNLFQQMVAASKNDHLLSKFLEAPKLGLSKPTLNTTTEKSNNIKKLCFKNCNIADDGFHSFLGKMQEATELSITECILPHFFGLPSMPNVTKLQVQDSVFAKESQIQSLVYLMPSLYSLNFIGRDEYQIFDFSYLNDLHTLGELKLANFRLSCNDGIPQKNCRTLSIKNVSMTDDDFNYLRQKFNKAEQLIVNNIYVKSNKDVAANFDLATFHCLVSLQVEADLLDRTLLPLLEDSPNIKHFQMDFLADQSQLGLVANILSERNLITVDLSGINSDNEVQQGFIEQLQRSSVEFLRINERTKQQHQQAPQTKSVPTPPQSSSDMDADTALNKDQKFQVQKIFYSIDGSEDPSPQSYRLEVFNDVTVNPNPCLPNEAFKLNHKGDLQLEPCDAVKMATNTRSETKELKNSEELKYFYGEQHLYVDQHWRPIGNLEAPDKMLFYHLSKEMDVEIQHSKRDDLYYIRSNKDADFVTLDFVIQSPQAKFLMLQVLAEPYHNFGEKALKIDTPDPTGNDYLAALRQQKQGACRHRTIAYYFDNQPVEIHIIRNEPHQLVEVKMNNTWHKVDLGGHPAEVKLYTANEAAAKEVAAKQEQATAAPKKALSPRNKPLDQSNPYVKPLSTWEKPAVIRLSTMEFFQSQFNSTSKQHLLECSSPQHILEIELGLEQYCKTTGKKVFYIDGPNDLVCAAPFVKREGDRGTLQENPSGGGPLHDFLTQHPDGILVINYANFPKEAIVRNNVLLDFPNRVADGTKISAETVIIGLYDTSDHNRYQGSDFYSRLQRVRAPSDPNLALEKAIYVNSESEKKPPFKIDLYHDQDWETVLLGRWVLQGNQLHYQAGKLQEALKQGHTHLQIENGLWEDPHFQLFWRQAKTRGEIEVAGETLKIPTDLHISSKQGYAFPELTSAIQLNADVNPKAITVNPALFSPLFYQYLCDDYGKTLTTLPGILEQHQGKTLEINLTHDLTRDQWGRLLQEAKIFQVQLTIHVASNVKVPTYITPNTVVADNQPLMQLPKHTQLITSTDRDVTKHHIIKNEKDWIVIDVSNCSPTDLISTITGRLQKEPLKFVFENDKRILTEALKENQKILLHGTLSTELQQALTGLLIERMVEPAAGRLVIVSEKLAELPFQVRNHAISADEKKKILGETAFTTTELENESLVRLQARERYARLKLNNENPWRGLYDLPNSSLFSEHPDFRNSNQLADAFDRQRLHQVQIVLAESPLVYLAGATAVGKTTFMNTLMSVPPYQLFHGEEELLKWINDKNPDTQKILFIDEENISRLGWAMFEGLFNRPPSILIDGKIHFLTDQHKVVFAGNPANYGAGREVSSLFERHGNVVLFERLSQEYVYQRLIKPIFQDHLSEKAVQMMAEHWLKVYRFLCACSTDEILISPREIQMMALLTLSYLKRIPDADPLAVAKHYAHFVTQHLVPGAMQDDFKAQFAPTTELSSLSLPHSEKILITPSRMKLMNQLQDVVALHEFRQQQATNNAQKHGGLGGIVIEGEPGIGKSDSVIALLCAQHYREAHLGEPEHLEGAKEKIFYRMHASMLLETKKTLLLRAFREGAIVIADEMNSAANPELERLLNELLMGKYKGEYSKNPGFLLVASQNPVSAGRTAASTAMARRCLASHAEEYPMTEKIQILMHRGVASETAHEMVAAFEMCHAKAVKEKLSPAPTFRDLMKLVPPKIQVAEIPLITINNQGSLEKWLQMHPTAEQASKQFKIPIQNLVYQFSQRYAMALANNASDDDPENVFASISNVCVEEAWQRICKVAQNEPSGLTKSVLVKMAMNEKVADTELTDVQSQSRRTQ